MKRFVLKRKFVLNGEEDNTIVAEGVEFLNGKVAVSWQPDNHRVVIWDSIDDLINTLLVDTELAWMDGEHRQIKRLIHRDLRDGQLVSREYASSAAQT